MTKDQLKTLRIEKIKADRHGLNLSLRELSYIYGRSPEAIRKDLMDK